MSKLLLCGTIMLLASPSLATQETEPVNDPETIVVTGQRQADVEAIREGIDQISPSLGPTDPIARFIDPICLDFAGLSPTQEATFRKLITFRGENAGARFAKTDCRTNALVVIVDDPKSFLDEAREKQSNLVSASDYRKLEASIADGDPVVAVRSQEVRTALGRPAPHTATIPGLTLPMAASTKVNTDARARRVGLEQSAALVNSIVIFDATKLAGFNLVQLADYAAMRLLISSDVSPAWQGGRPDSILKLFSNSTDDIESSMTLFDESYLAAVYGLPLNAAPSRLKSQVLAGYLERSQN